MPSWRLAWHKWTDVLVGPEEHRQGCELTFTDERHGATWMWLESLGRHGVGCEHLELRHLDLLSHLAAEGRTQSEVGTKNCGAGEDS